MAEVLLSEEARVDLEEIRTTGTERFGANAAERHLRDFPRALMGRP